MCELYLWIASALASCAPASAYDRLAAANAVRSRRGEPARPLCGSEAACPRVSSSKTFRSQVPLWGTRGAVGLIRPWRPQRPAPRPHAARGSPRQPASRGGGPLPQKVLAEAWTPRGPQGKLSLPVRGPAGVPRATSRTNEPPRPSSIDPRRRTRRAARHLRTPGRAYWRRPCTSRAADPSTELGWTRTPESSLPSATTRTCRLRSTRTPTDASRFRPSLKSTRRVRARLRCEMYRRKLGCEHAGLPLGSPPFRITSEWQAPPSQAQCCVDGLESLHQVTLPRFVSKSPPATPPRAKVRPPATHSQRTAKPAGVAVVPHSLRIAAATAPPAPVRSSVEVESLRFDAELASQHAPPE